MVTILTMLIMFSLILIVVVALLRKDLPKAKVRRQERHEMKRLELIDEITRALRRLN